MKNKVLASLLTLVSSSALIIIARVLGFRIGLLLAMGSLPPLIFSIYFGIKDYRSFFLLQKEPSLDISLKSAATQSTVDGTSDITIVKINQISFSSIAQYQPSHNYVVSHTKFENAIQRGLIEEFTNRSRRTLLADDIDNGLDSAGSRGINLADLDVASC